MSAAKVIKMKIRTGILWGIGGLLFAIAGIMIARAGRNPAAFIVCASLFLFMSTIAQAGGEKVRNDEDDRNPQLPQT